MHDQLLNSAVLTISQLSFSHSFLISCVHAVTFPHLMQQVDVVLRILFSIYPVRASFDLLATLTFFHGYSLFAQAEIMTSYLLEAENRLNNI
jgi:hypothetical protein